MKKDYNELISKFRKGQITRRELINTLCDIIIKIPSYMNCYDEDTKNDFFLHVISSLDKIIAKYRRVSNCSFKTWFIFILKRRFIQFSTRLKLKEERNGILETKGEFDENTHQFSYYSEKNENYPEINIESLNGIELEILKLKYGLGKELKILEDELLHKITKKKVMEDRISNNYNKLIITQENIKNTYSQEEKKRLMEKEDRIRKNKRNNEDYYNRINTTPSNKWISSQLNIAEGTVATYLSRLKQKIKKDYLKEENDDDTQKNISDKD